MKILQPREYLSNGRSLFQSHGLPDFSTMTCSFRRGCRALLSNLLTNELYCINWRQNEYRLSKFFKSDLDRLDTILSERKSSRGSNVKGMESLLRGAQKVRSWSKPTCLPSRKFRVQEGKNSGWHHCRLGTPMKRCVSRRRDEWHEEVMSGSRTKRVSA
jgi:hypothetical protein